MGYTTIIAPKPGTPPVKLEKRTSDSVVCQIDCSPLLNVNELIYGLVTVSNSALTISEIKPRSGKYIRFKVTGGPTGIPYTDYQITFLVRTSNDSELSIPVIIRAYSL